MLPRDAQARELGLVNGIQNRRHITHHSIGIAIG